MLTALRQQALNTLLGYLREYPEESSSLSAFRAQLDSGEDCFVRSNMTGHLTTSAAVLSADLKQILLIDHRVLNIWMPPGGHFELDTTFWESAAREVAEETGVSSLALHPWCATRGVPFDIDTHSVPANPAKGEGAHLHHDFRFLAIAANELELVPQLAEVRDAKWVSVDKLRGIPNRRLTTLAEKLDRFVL
jgi:ADP-ribose pyrophosphatase YjhB (NUDIX family)